MSASTPSAAPKTGALTREDTKVLAATLVGTAIEWYDYFIYAQAAGLVLGPLFFAPISRDSPGLAQILSFATIGISFLFRPLGAIVCGYLGDRLGRKVILVMTLILMGASTALIGLLPGYAQIGAWAPILLIVLLGRDRVSRFPWFTAAIVFSAVHLIADHLLHGNLLRGNRSGQSPGRYQFRSSLIGLLRSDHVHAGCRWMGLWLARRCRSFCRRCCARNRRLRGNGIRIITLPHQPRRAWKKDAKRCDRQLNLPAHSTSLASEVCINERFFNESP